MGNRMSAIVSLIGVRAGAAGLALVLAPRWFRRVIFEFAKLSDNEMRIVGYVLLGTAAGVLGQAVLRQELSSKIDALSSQRPALAS